MDNDKISQLAEMGFSQEQSKLALQLANGNLEDAIAYLFDEPIEQPPLPPNQQHTPTNENNNQIIKYQDSVQIKNPKDIPDFGPLTSEDLLPSVNSDILQSSSDNNQNNNNVDWDQFEHIEQQDVESVFDYPIGYEKNETDYIPVILPKFKISSQSVIIALVAIFSQISQLKDVLLSKNFEDYGFSENWFTHEASNEIEIPEGLNEKEYKLIIEIQKFIIFLTTNLSNRLFISGETFCKNLPNELINQENDDWEEILKKFIPNLKTLVENILNQDIDKLFYSKVESISGQTASLHNFILDSDNKGSSIQESFDKLFWDGPELVTLTNLSKIIIIQVNGDELSYEIPQPIQIEEMFYPGIYSNDISSIIKSMNEKKEKVKIERNQITNKLMSLNSFEGKRIKTVLQNSINYIKSINENEALADLTKLTKNINNESEYLNNKLLQLNSDYVRYEIRNHENVLKSMKDANLPIPKPYKLIGIIVSDSDYFYKSKLYNNNVENWVYFTPDDDRNRVLRYRSETMSFDQVQQVITDLSKNGSKSFLLIYAEEDEKDEEDEEVDEVDEIETPENLKQFFIKDNELVKEQVEKAKENDIEIEETEVNNSDNNKENDDVKLIDLDDDYIDDDDTNNNKENA
ncbi:unnamed protein product [Candida verbasci]|uniref:UBA domain-containing protein n=1 Tax=Candida verbasci TaxID=1227364 RepID=A0A9W4X9W8_9ASCO|nr:unnamed protein product [Candida verbasci]